VFYFIYFLYIYLENKGQCILIDSGGPGLASRESVGDRGSVHESQLCVCVCCQHIDIMFCLNQSSPVKSFLGVVGMLFLFKGQEVNI